MKRFTKFVLLVALAVLFTMAACTRQASSGPVGVPTTDTEAPFPYTTPSNNLEALGTLTAIAETPQADATATPEIVLETPAGQEPQPEQPPTTDQSSEEAGGGREEPGAAAPQPQPPAASANIPPITRPETYTLQRGEWPICIARRFDLDLGTFFQANGLSMASKPAAGTVLRIPSSGSWNPSYGSRSLKAHPTTHTVSAGETVYGIACSYGDVSPEQILAANNLSNPSDITAGMTINIP